jgi:hypothetical protein
VTPRSSKLAGQGRHPGGRPRKFSEPSRPITITLPATTLRQLEQIDEDRGRAIVKLAKSAAWGDTKGKRAPVEIVELSGDTGLVIIGPAPSLKKIEFLRLVEVAPARFLLALKPGHNFHELELALTDVMEDLSSDKIDERLLISELLSNIKTFRKSDAVSVAQILLMRLRPDSQSIASP